MKQTVKEKNLNMIQIIMLKIIIFYTYFDINSFVAERFCFTFNIRFKDLNFSSLLQICSLSPFLYTSCWRYSHKPASS